jgi:hypothetical protein
MRPGQEASPCGSRGLEGWRQLTTCHCSLIYPVRNKTAFSTDEYRPSHSLNKGNKQWWEDWETHVDLLEDEEIGPLYRNIRLFETEAYHLRSGLGFLTFQSGHPLSGGIQ